MEAEAGDGFPASTSRRRHGGSNPGRHEHVERVVAAGEEKADEGLVVRGCRLGGEGIRQPQAQQGREQGGGPHPGATGLADELAAGKRRGGGRLHSIICSRRLPARSQPGRPRAAPGSG